MRKFHRSSTLITNLFLAAILYAVSGPLASAGLYKWVDDDGNVRYSDRLPPQQSRKTHSTLNAQGVVVSTREGRTEEELAAEAEAKRIREQKEAEAARLRAIQIQKDQVLLMTFSSVEELEHAHANRLEVLDSVINLLQSNIEHTQEKLADLQERAEVTYLSKGKEVPGGLAQKIEHFERKIQTRSRQLELKLVEKEKINAKFDADLARFQQLQAPQ